MRTIHVRDASFKSSMDSLQDVGDEAHKSSSSVGGKVERDLASGTSPHLPSDPAAIGIVGRVVASGPTPLMPPDAGNVEPFATGAAPLPSASATLDFDGNCAPSIVYGPHCRL